MTFADKIRLLRFELRLSQKELAAQIGGSQTSISSYENYGKFPVYHILVKLHKLIKDNDLDIDLLGED